MSHHSDPRYSADWDGAICAQLGGNAADPIFFPGGPDQAKQAVAMCWECPMKAVCLVSALDEERGTPVHERFGIRGGLTARQRVDLDPGKICVECGSPIITRSEHCDDDREIHRLKHRREYERERRRDAA